MYHDGNRALNLHSEELFSPLQVIIICIWEMKSKLHVIYWAWLFWLMRFILFLWACGRKLYIISCVSGQNKCPVTDPPEPPFGSTANEYFDDTEAPARGKTIINTIRGISQFL